MAKDSNFLKKRIISVSLLAITAVAALSALPTPKSRLSAAALREAKQLAPLSRSTNAKWRKRHEDIMTKSVSAQHDVILLGDSITQGWELNRVAWERQIDSLPAQKVLNAGIASDRIEHILWRVQSGLFTNTRPKICVLMAGINNIGMASAETIASGVGQIVDEIKRQSPTTKILVLGLLPSGKEAEHPRRGKIKMVNRLLEQVVQARQAEFLDTGSQFLQADGTLPKSISFDGVHLTQQGYQIWAAALKLPLKKISRS